MDDDHVTSGDFYALKTSYNAIPDLIIVQNSKTSHKSSKEESITKSNEMLPRKTEHSETRI